MRCGYFYEARERETGRHRERVNGVTDGVRAGLSDKLIFYKDMCQRFKEGFVHHEQQKIKVTHHKNFDRKVNT